MTEPDVTGAGSGHAVLATVDSEAFGSLCRRPTSRAERHALGRRLRKQVPRSAIGDWAPSGNRPDVVAQIRRSHEGRLEWLMIAGYVGKSDNSISPPAASPAATPTRLRDHERLVTAAARGEIVADPDAG